MDGGEDGWLNEWPIKSAFCFSILTTSEVKMCRALYFSNKINNYYSRKIRKSAYTAMKCADVPIARGFYADVYELFFVQNRISKA